MSRYLADARQDLRYGIRSLRKSPGFAVVAILSLALGIGANTTVFSFINAVLLAPLPLGDPSRLALIVTVDERNPTADMGVSRDNYIDLRDNSREIFEHLTAIADLQLHISSGNGEPERVDAEIVTADFFSTMQVSPLLGRGFLPDEDAVEGAKLVTVLGYALWQRRFGGDPAIVGQSVLINNQQFTVVGVMPPRFRAAHQVGGPELWVPLMSYPVTTSGQTRTGIASRRFTWFGLIGRLRPGVTIEQAASAATSIGRRLQTEYPNDNQGRNFLVRPLIGLIPDDRGGVVASGGMLLAIVALVLFIACANVANLFLVRAVARQREVAIRQALGAGRARLVRQLLTEGVIISAISGAVGLVFTDLAQRALWAFRPPQMTPDALELRIDTPVLAFAVIASCVACIVSSLAPALKAWNSDLVLDLKEKGAGATGPRALMLRHSLVALQVALSVVVLVGAGLFVRSLQRAQEVELGFDVNRLAGMRVDLGAQGYTEEQAREFQKQVVDRVGAVPGVRAAVFADLVPLFGGGALRTIFVEGEDPSDSRNGRLVETGVVAPAYFRVVGLRLVAGRTFLESDQPNTPSVAMVSDTLARAFWPGQNPIGRRLKFSRGGYLEVIGVVADSSYGSVGAPPAAVLYRSLTQVNQPTVSLLVHSDQPAAVLPAARSLIRQLDPNLPITNAATLADAVQQFLWAPRMAAWLLTLLGLISLTLAIVGIYGVMAYAVSQRAREFGLRLALGATRGDVLGLVLRQGARLSIVGVVIGIAVSLAISRFVASLLYGSATDPVAFVAAAAILAAAALVASYVPARRATRVDPTIALRDLVQ